MSTYHCHQCEIEIRVSPMNGTNSVFADVCPSCGTDDDLEYL